MAELNVSQTTTPSTLADYRVSSVSPDVPGDQERTVQQFPNFTKNYGIYKSVAKIKSAINAYATWILGKGWVTEEAAKQAALEAVDGNGEDTLNSILWNMIVMKKVNGDSFAQIIRNDTRALINLVILNPQNMGVVYNKKGRIIEYEYTTPAGTTKSAQIVSFKPHEILHFSNDRVVNEMHGVSVIEAVTWNIEATEETKRQHRKMQYRNGVVRVIEVDSDNTTKRNKLKAEWKDAIEKGDVLILPKGTAEAKDWHGTLNTQEVLSWLGYLDDDFYQSLNVPKIILGGNPDNTEAGAKMSYQSFEPIYTREITELEADMWNQLAIRIKFLKPASMMDNIQSDEAANTGQIGLQPNDTQAGVGA